LRSVRSRVHVRLESCASSVGVPSGVEDDGAVVRRDLGQGGERARAGNADLAARDHARDLRQALLVVLSVAVGADVEAERRDRRDGDEDAGRSHPGEVGKPPSPLETPGF